MGERSALLYSVIVAALREEAQADADALTIRAAAKKADLLAEAEGRQAIVDAENAITAEIVGMKVDLARLEAMPAIVAEMVKPAEKIDSIKIHSIGGAGLGGGALGGTTANEGGKPVVNQALDSILGMAVQLPALSAAERGWDMSERDVRAPSAL